MNPKRRPEDRKPRSWELYEPQPSRSRSSVGCGVLLLISVIGAVIGGLIAIATTPSETEYFGPDYGSDVGRLVGGAFLGFLIGFLVGAAILWAVSRRSR
jgi:hypothetical protein